MRRTHLKPQERHHFPDCHPTLFGFPRSRFANHCRAPSCSIKKPKQPPNNYLRIDHDGPRRRSGKHGLFGRVWILVGTCEIWWPTCPSIWDSVDTSFPFYVVDPVKCDASLHKDTTMMTMTRLLLLWWSWTLDTIKVDSCTLKYRHEAILDGSRRTTTTVTLLLV